ncbi:MAG: hypothetical protein HFI71_05945 [Lachnospiraceae bacterium]|nr:hypothetical protein [Lachnospiraceae bacterium]
MSVSSSTGKSKLSIIRTQEFAAHFYTHIEEKEKYISTKTSIYYTNTPAVKIKNPNAKPLFMYPDSATANRFDSTNVNYRNMKAYTEQERFILGLYPYLKDHADSLKYRFSCRASCEKMSVSLFQIFVLYNNSVAANKTTTLKSLTFWEHLT